MKSTKKTTDKPMAEESTPTPEPTSPSPSSMTEQEMKNLLVELGDTTYWQAIKRHHAMRCIVAENALCTIDAFKYPTDMARNQGIRIGLMDLESYVVVLQKRREEAAKTEAEKNKNSK